MKKQNVIAAVGTVALLANLLVPGLAFGQGANSQEATQEINCPTGTTQELNFSVPAAVTFDSKVASGDTQQAYDASLVAEAIIPDAAHNLVVTDTRSGGAQNCPLPTNNPGFSVTAVMDGAGLVNGNSTVIPSSQFRIITTPAVDPAMILGATLPETSNPVGSGTNADFAPSVGRSLWYTNPANTAGNLHDVTTPVAFDDTTPGDGTNEATQFRTKASYTTHPDTLDSAVTLMETFTSHFNHFATGVVLQSEIPANQESGVYTGTLTYTLAAV